MGRSSCQHSERAMLILLICVSFIYVLTGDYGEALFMFAAIVGVTAISFYQDNRSKKALERT
jgi:Ca2+-transporting ATPase